MSAGLSTRPVARASAVGVKWLLVAASAGVGIAGGQALSSTALSQSSVAEIHASIDRGSVFRLYYNNTWSSQCYLPPQPRSQPPPSQTALYWTYCSAANSTTYGAWAVSGKPRTRLEPACIRV